MALLALTFSGLRFLDAANEETWQSADRKLSIRYAVEFPAQPTDGRLPAIIFTCHGSGGTTDQQMPAVAEALRRIGVRNSYIVVGIHSQDSAWKTETSGNTKALDAFIPWALHTWKADPRRVYMEGFSAGAFMTIRYVETHKKVIAGGVAWAGSIGRGFLPQDKGASQHAPLYWVNGLADHEVDPVQAGITAKELASWGYPIVWRGIRGIDHAANYEPPQDDAYRWLDLQRNRLIPPVGNDAAFLAKVANRATGPALLLDPATWNRIAAIGGPSISPILMRAFMDRNAIIRTQAATTCARVYPETEVVRGMIRLVLDKDPQVRSAAFAAASLLVQWQRPEAEAALCELAKPRYHAADWLTAADALGKAVSLDLLGGYCNTRAIKALVISLNDKDLSIRQEAFAALQPAKTGGFGYLPEQTPKDRASALQHWSLWLTRIQGPPQMDGAKHP